MAELHYHEEKYLSRSEPDEFAILKEASTKARSKNQQQPASREPAQPHGCWVQPLRAWAELKVGVFYSPNENKIF